MKLEGVVDNLDAVPEDIRENYEKREDGKFVLTHLKDVEDVSGLKSALGKERDNSRKAAKELKELREQFVDIDPEDYRALKEAKRVDDEEKAKAAGQWDKLRDQMVQQHNTALAAKDTVATRYRTSLEKHLVDSVAVTAIAAAEGNTDLLLPHVKSRVKVVEDDKGEFSVRIVDAQGNPRVNGSGEFLGITDLVSEMRGQETFGGAFKAKTPGGGGGAPPNPGGKGGDNKPGGGPIPKDLQRSKMKTADKVKFIKEHGEKAFLDLPN